MRLDGKRVLVTAAGQGIGRACAEAMAAEGAQVFATDINMETLATLDGAETFQMDASDPDQIIAAAERARPDILVNCAGASQGGVFWEIPDKIWQDSLDLKFLGTIRMIRAVIPQMRKQKYGRIVTVAGSAGKQPHARILPGSAANAALLAVTTGLAQEVAADNIVVNAVNPGPSRTERWNTLMKNLASNSGTTVEDVEQGFMADIPMNRLGEPEEIARLIAFLASDAAANMTGTSITADGGWTKALA